MTMTFLNLIMSCPLIFISEFTLDLTHGTVKTEQWTLGGWRGVVVRRQRRGAQKNWDLFQFPATHPLKKATFEIVDREQKITSIDFKTTLPLDATTVLGFDKYYFTRVFIIKKHHYFGMCSSLNPMFILIDYVRDGKIQGQWCLKKTKERPCISPCLT